MEHETFAINEITVHRGQTLTLTNDSRYMHIIGPGVDGTLWVEDGNPMRERVLTEVDDSYTTTTWQEPGTYYITCSMHPEMTVKVIVTP